MVVKVSDHLTETPLTYIPEIRPASFTPTPQRYFSRPRCTLPTFHTFIFILLSIKLIPRYHSHCATCFLTRFSFLGLSSVPVGRIVSLWRAEMMPIGGDIKEKFLLFFFFSFITAVEMKAFRILYYDGSS